MIKASSQNVHSIKITPACNGGYIVNVGCEVFIMENKPEKIKDMCTEIAEYLICPERYQQEFSHLKYGEDTVGPDPQPVEPLGR